MLRPIVLGLLLIGAVPAGRPLFDGESLAGWTAMGGKPGNWRAEPGLLVVRGDGKGWLSTNRAFGDFVLSLEYRVGPAGNSGVLLRAPHQGDPSFDGLEIQILDDDAPAYAQLRPDQYTGSIYGVVAARRGRTRPAGQWNTMAIVARGSRIQVILNGESVVDVDLKDHPEAVTKHPGIRRTSGFVGLQSHESRVEFRAIRILEDR